ncbi:MAG: hypothetical protein KAR32_13415 [Candidatus Omnitrophica bacterium]|nr:hypothetical protein [Candidatus Omnitrophota bacterium]
MKKHNVISLLIFFAVSIAYTLFIFRDISYWGQFDGDQFTFWNAVARKTILEYHQFPLWNPYANGGNILLAHPHSSFLSPLYIFVLMFGPVVGLKVQIIAYLAIGLSGMFLLAQYMRLSRNSSYLTAFVYMLSSIYALHITEGQASWVTMAFVPWVFLYYSKSLKDSKQALGAIVFLGLIFLAGSVDVFNILIAFLSIYAFLKLCQLRCFLPIKMVAIIFAGTFLLCAIKLFPMFEFLFQYPRVTDESSGTNLMTLFNMLLSRKQVFLNDYVLSWQSAKEMGLKYQWHEYGAYVGIVPLALYFCGVVKRFRENWPLILTGLIFLLIALGSESPINLWKILHSFPIYDSLHVPSRFIFGFVFSVALLSGWGLMFFEKIISATRNKMKISPGEWVSFAVVMCVLFDLLLVNAPIFKEAFRISPLKVARNASFRQRYKDENFLRYEMINSVKCHLSYSSMYPILLSNSGILEAYEVVNVKKGHVRSVSDPDYRGETYLAGSNGNILAEYFSPNKLTIDVHVKVPDVLVINQNYYTGWRVKRNGKILRAGSFNGLIAEPVLPGRHRVTFFYMPLSFLIGLFVSVSFILSVAVFYLGMTGKYNLKNVGCRENAK